MFAEWPKSDPENFNGAGTGDWAQSGRARCQTGPRGLPQPSIPKFRRTSWRLREQVPAPVPHTTRSAAFPACTCAPPRCSLRRPLERTFGGGNGSLDLPLVAAMVRVGLTSHCRHQRYVLVQPFSGAHPRRWGWILHHLSSRTTRALTPRAPGASHSAFSGFSPSTSPDVPMSWPAMLLMFTANPLLPKLEDSTPCPTGRPSLVHFLASSPRAPPPALWSGHYNGPSAAGTDRRGLPAIPAANAPF